MIMVSSGERSWTASLNKFSKCCGTIPLRVPMAYAEDEKKLINTMQRQGIIQKSSSPWSSPLVLVMKKNGKIRPCVDYRRLNSVTKKDAFPLPRMFGHSLRSYFVQYI
jgi:hypothetical protein